ncbi:MAG TPA: hypothetical protein VN914_04735 [Polyangia bacterium]|nr:hypothetical protein [Polyangia bacterium]
MATFGFLMALFLGCSSSPARHPSGTGGDEGGSGGGETGGAPGTGGKATGGSPGTGGKATGGAPATGGNGGSDTGGSPGTGGAPTDGGSKPDAAQASDGPSGTGGMPGPTTPGQGPTALGKVVYSNDFENGIGCMTRSPNGLPEDRVQVVDDPKGERGKVVKIVWQSGDNYRTSSGTQPRSWFSNASCYQVKPGTKVSFAWGFMWTDVAMDAFFAQNIGPGPVWELRVRANGRFQVLCNQCGGNSPDLMMLTPNRWYDFRVDMDWTGGGKVQFFVDGQMAYQSTMGGASANCHWDGGIYNTPGGTATNKTRTVYLSNLSVGER